MTCRPGLGLRPNWLSTILKFLFYRPRDAGEFWGALAICELDEASQALIYGGPVVTPA